MENSTSYYTQHLVTCPKCKDVLNTRVKRNLLLKLFFFWLPIRVYFCQKCVAKRYFWGHVHHHGHHEAEHEVNTAQTAH